jgi:hypothetical protein
MTTTIVTVATLTEGLERAWLQHLRDFDTAHPGCHFQVKADWQEKSVAEASAILQSINPPFSRLATLTDEDRDLLAEALRPQFGPNSRSIIDSLIDLALKKYV